MTSSKPQAGAAVGPMTWQTVEGGSVTVGAPKDRWSMLFVYRGKHCPRCQKYLNILNDMTSEWIAAGFDIAVVSADPEAKAKADQDEFGWSFDLGYDLNAEQMEALGLYVSTPLSDVETDRPFAEPGTFVLRPDGTLLLVSISNGPSARPELAELLDGMIFTKENDRPPRGLG